MKPDNVNLFDVKSNLVGEKIAVTIDDSSFAHIMNSLTKLYSDQELAVIREYSTNAFDSHVEAGQKRPIEVTLPSPLAPNFKVKDYGVGMDIHDIRSIYSRYGASTKRNSNAVVGMLGFGCKSAWAYTDQFSVIGIKNGRAIHAICAKQANGIPDIQIVNEWETQDHPGVEIIVPAKQGNQFEAKAKNFFRFWTPGTVLVNGVEPKRIDGIWISKDIVLTAEVQRPMIVMGNVAYPDPHSYDSGYNNLKSVSFVNIGDVNFTPSRESLEVTPKTNQKLNELKARIKKETNDALLKIVAAAKTPWEAIQEVRKNKAAGLDANTAVWQGKKIPIKFETELEWVDDPYNAGNKKHQNKRIYLWHNTYGYSKYSWSTDTSVTLMNYGNELIWIRGYDSDKFTPYKSQKLDQFWAKHNNGGLRRVDKFVFCDEIPKSVEDWIDPATIYEWADVEAEKIVKTANQTLRSGRPSGSYYSMKYVPTSGVYSAHWKREDILAKDIDTTKPLFWNPGNKWHSSPYVTWLSDKYPDATFIFLPSNRIEKFKRDFPTAERVNEKVKELAADWVKNLTEDQKVAICVKTSMSYNVLTGLDAATIDDPDLKYAVEMSKVDIKGFTQNYDFFKRHEGIEVTSKWNYDALKKYPLLACTRDTFARSHAPIYVNAVYAANQKSKNNTGGTNV